jgi:hypothetical protein
MGLPSQDLGVYTVESVPTELPEVLTGVSAAGQLHLVYFSIISSSSNSSMTSMDWTYTLKSVMSEIEEDLIRLQMVVHEWVGCKLLVHSVHTHTHTHTHPFLCYSPGQVLVS